MQVRLTLLRLVSLLYVSSLFAQQHSYSPDDIAGGAMLYRANCSVCHGLEGDTVAGVDLRRGRFRRGSSDDDLMNVITNGIPGSAMPPHNFVSSQLWSLVAYIRTMHEFGSRSNTSADPHRGRLLFEGKGNCLSCHRVNGTGAIMGPDLSEIGIIRPVSHLERALVEPRAAILPQHRIIRAITREGTVIVGRRLNEDTHTLQLLDSKQRLLSLSKAELRDLRPANDSPMPSYKDKLTRKELDDLIAYLASLKGAGAP
jgi:putative heme-binding domain-containing protein